jgi:hypothetical protein
MFYSTGPWPMFKVVIVASDTWGLWFRNLREIKRFRSKLVSSGFNLTKTIL